MGRKTVFAPYQALLGLIALVGLSFLSAGGGMAREAAEGALTCDLPAMDAREIVLRPECTYRGMILISRSDTVLDCRGALIDASASPNGIRVRGERLRNIRISNCRIDAAKSQGLVIQQPTNDVTMAALPRERRYDEGVQDVIIENVSITRSATVGLYVDSYSQRIVIKGARISKSGGAGIYLEHSSIRTSVSDSVIEDNGAGDLLGRRKRGMRREGIAIDSSAHNVIRNNRFRGNRAGGVFLYKNCWEHHSRGRTAQRWLPASHNLIEGNRFEDEKVGIWVASRQSLDLSKWDCGDQALAPGYYRDRADHNRIVGNHFDRGQVGVRVNDDFTTLSGNTFNSPEKECVQLGSLVRDRVVGGPVIGTDLSDNSCAMAPAAGASETPVADGFRSVGISRFSACEGNRVDGRPMSCR